MIYYLEQYTSDSKQSAYKLYVAPKTGQDRGYLYYLVFQYYNENTNGKLELELDLNTALTSSKLQGSFVFTLLDPGLNEKNVNDFVDSINSILIQPQVIMWSTDPGNINSNTVLQLQLNGDGGWTASGSCLDVPITDNLSLVARKNEAFFTKWQHYFTVRRP